MRKPRRGGDFVVEVFTRVQELIEDWEAGYQAALDELAAWQLDTHV